MSDETLVLIKALENAVTQAVAQMNKSRGEESRALIASLDGLNKTLGNLVHRVEQVQMQVAEIHRKMPITR